MNTRISRMTAAAVAFTLVVAACSSDNPTASTTVDMSSPAGSESEVASTTSMAGMDGDTDGEHDHEVDGEADGEHSHDTIDWPADLSTPRLNLTATPNADGSAELVVGIEDFTLQSGDGADDGPGTGHLHVMVDSRDFGMSFVPEVHLDGLNPGPHMVEIQLSSPSHGMYAIDGEILTYSAELVMPGEVVAVDTVIDITVDEGGVVGGIVDASVGIGETVQINIVSGVAEEFHLHVYDITAALVPGENAELIFTADIPGVFEAELEGASVQILNLEVK